MRSILDVFKLRSDRLREYFKIPIPAEDDLEFWDGLLETFGLPLLPFLLSREALERLPCRLLGIPRINVGSITPAKNEAWILFSYQTAGMVAGSPLRCDGFLLICEWRRGGAHSPLLPDSLCSLAGKVAAQQGAADWSLHPSFCRYSDKIDFSDRQLFASRDDDDLIASAWSALATGLCYAVHEITPGRWPFSSIQFDFAGQRIMPVGGLAAKLAIAGSFHAGEFLVAAGQLPEARNLVGRTIRIVGIKPHREIACLIEDLALGTLRKRRDRRRRRAAALIAAGVFSLAAAGYYLAFHHPVRTYFQNIANHRDSIIRGITPLSRDIAARKIGNYRFSRRGFWGKLAEVSLVDGLDRPAAYGSIDPIVSDLLPLNSRPHLQRTVKIAFAGNLITGYDMFGNRTYAITWSDAGATREMRFAGQNGGNIVSGQVSYLKMSFDPVSGDAASVRFFTSRNLKALDLNGVHGYNLNFAARRVDLISGRELPDDDSAPAMRSLTMTYVDVNEQPVKCADGFTSVEFLYPDDGTGLARFIFFRDRDGKPAVNSRGVAGWRMTYDRNRNPARTEYWDAERRPVDSAATPMAITTFYDVPRATCEAAGSHRTLALPKLVTRVNAYGLDETVEMLHYLGGSKWTLENPAFTGSGKKMSYLNQGRTVIAEWLNPQPGHPSGSIDQYDSCGRQISQTFTDSRGRPVAAADGLARITNSYRTPEYDDDNLVRITSRWRLDGSAFESPSQPHCEVAQIDKYGNLVEFAGFDAAGKPANMNRDGVIFHRCQLKYFHKFIVEINYLTADGGVPDGPFPSRCEWEYNDQNLPIRERFFGGEKLAANPLTGVAETRMEYHPLTGGRLRQRFFDADKQLCVNRLLNFADCRTEVSADGQPVEIRVYDREGREIDDISGRHRRVFKYDRNGVLEGMLAYRRNGRPALPLARVAMFDGCLKSGDVVLQVGSWQYRRESEDMVWPHVTGKILDRAEVVFARRGENGWELRRTEFSGFLPLTDWYLPEAEELRIAALPGTDSRSIRSASETESVQPTAAGGVTPDRF